MRSVVSFFLLILCAAIWLPTPALADGGGWPTATPTITPTHTPLAPASVAITPPVPSIVPDGGITGITPPAITPLVSASGSTLTPGPITPTATPPTATTTSVTTGSTSRPIACWPIAIIALIVGVALFSWLRSGMRKGD